MLENEFNEKTAMPKRHIEDNNLLKKLKPVHKGAGSNYFDEDFFRDLVLNRYLPSIKRDGSGRIVSRDTAAEKEVLAQMLLIVNAVINKYGIWRFESMEVLQDEGLGECWRALPAFDPNRGKKYFHFLSLVVKYHLINLTRREKISRETADIEIQPDLKDQREKPGNFFIDDFEKTLFDTVDEFFDDDRHALYTDLASVLVQYIAENGSIVGRNDFLSYFKEYGYRMGEVKRFLADIGEHREIFYELAS